MRRQRNGVAVCSMIVRVARAPLAVLIVTGPIDFSDQSEAGESVIKRSVVVGWGLGGGEDGFSEKATS